MVLGKAIRDTFLVQATIKVAVVGAHQHRDRLMRWQVGTECVYGSHHLNAKCIANAKSSSLVICIRHVGA